MQVPILIVGAGPAGLCSSISLSRLGVRSLVVERHASTSIHPKATGISTRTMELFRSWGIEGRVREAAISARFSSSIRDALSGPEVDRRSLGYPTAAEAAAFSPTWAAVLAQDHLEPILLDHARSYSTAEVRFSTEVVDLERDRRTGRADGSADEHAIELRLPDAAVAVDRGRDANGGASRGGRFEQHLQVA